MLGMAPDGAGAEFKIEIARSRSYWVKLKNKIRNAKVFLVKITKNIKVTKC